MRAKWQRELFEKIQDRLRYFAFGHYRTTLLRPGSFVAEVNRVEANLFKLTRFERDRCESITPSESLGGIVESLA